MSYSITFHCPDYDVFKDVLKSLEEIARKREDKKKKDKRSDLMKELHRRTKEFHEQNSLIDYKTCLSIIADQIKEEKDIKDAKDIILDSVIDILDSVIDISNVDV